jgi:hypothetical protein
MPIAVPPGARPAPIFRPPGSMLEPPAAPGAAAAGYVIVQRGVWGGSGGSLSQTTRAGNTLIVYISSNTATVPTVTATGVNGTIANLTCGYWSLGHNGDYTGIFYLLNTPPTVTGITTSSVYASYYREVQGIPANPIVYWNWGGNATAGTTISVPISGYAVAGDFTTAVVSYDVSNAGTVHADGWTDDQLMSNFGQTSYTLATTGGSATMTSATYDDCSLTFKQVNQAGVPPINWSAVPGTFVNSYVTSGQSSLAVTPVQAGNLLVVYAKVSGGTISVSGVSGTGTTGWQQALPNFLDTYSTPQIQNAWIGTITAAGSTTLNLTFSAAIGSTAVELCVQEFNPGTGVVATYTVDVSNTQTNSGSANYHTWPTLTPSTANGELFVGFGRVPGLPGSGTLSTPSAPAVLQQDSNNNPFLYALNIVSAFNPQIWDTTSAQSYTSGFLVIATPTTPVSETDTAGAADVLGVGAAVPLPDAAGAAEAVSITATTSSADVAGAVDALAVSVAIPLAEAAGAADAIAITAKMETLQDAFPGSSLNGSLWNSYGPVSVSAGTLTLTDAASSTAGNAGIYSVAHYDLTGSYLLVHLTSAGGQYSTTQANLQVYLNSNNLVSLQVNNGSLLAITEVAGSYTTQGSIAYSATSMAWLRIRESSGTLYFDYGPDGHTWTNLASAADPFAVTSLLAYVQEGQYGGSDPQATSTWASLNMPQAPLPDAAGAADALAVSSAVPLAERGAAADQLAVSAAVPLAEAAGAADSLAVAHAITLADTAGAADQVAVAAAVPLAEVAAAAEALSVVVTVPLSETAGASDKAAITATVSLPDAGAAAESMIIGIAQADAAGATDALAVSVTIQLTDTAGAAESQVIGVSYADAAGSADAISITASTSTSDAAGAAEAVSVSAAVPLTETAAASDAIAVVVTAGLADTAGAADQLAVSSAVALADRAAAVEAQAIGLSQADVAGAVEALTVQVTTSLADSAGAADSIAVTYAISLADAAAGSEAVAITAAVPEAEAGAASDTLTVTAAASLAEVAGAVDALSVVAGSAVSYADAAAGSDAVTIAASVPETDVAGAADTAAVAATLSLAEAAAAADAISVAVLNPVALADAAGAKDTLAASAAVVITETAGATDSITASVAAPAADAAGAADAISVVVGGQAVNLADSGAGADQISVAATANLADVSGAADALTVGATALAQDDAASTDALGVTAGLSVADAAGAADALSVVVSQAVTLADAAAAQDAISVSVSVPLAEAGGAADVLTISALVALTEAAGAADRFVSISSEARTGTVFWEAHQDHARWLAVAEKQRWEASSSGARWLAEPRQARWDTEPEQARWRAEMGQARWAAQPEPGRWEATLQTFSPISSTSPEFVNIRWTSDLDGTSVDPTLTPLGCQYALPVSSGNLAEPAAAVTWYTGAWLLDGTGKGYVQQCIVGPGTTGPTLTAGKYDVWGQVQGTPEAPKKFVGVLTVY